MADRALSVTIDGVALGSATTDAVGQGAAPHAIPEGSGLGTRTLTSAWAGEQAYGHAGASPAFTVPPGTIDLWLLEPRSAARGGAVHLRAYARSLPWRRALWFHPARRDSDRYAVWVRGRNIGQRRADASPLRPQMAEVTRRARAPVTPPAPL